MGPLLTHIRNEFRAAKRAKILMLAAFGLGAAAAWGVVGHLDRIRMLDYEATITSLSNSLALAYDLSGAPAGVPTGARTDSTAGK